jgi:transcriptional regulator with XRE-family HTH domain
MTQQELGIAIGLSPRSKGYISELESGKKLPPIGVLIKLSSLFEVSIDQLVREELDFASTEIMPRKDSGA